MDARLRLDGTLDHDGASTALAETHALLGALADTPSLAGAARRLGISYRSAWGRVASLERMLGRAVVVKTKGHGSALTPFGAALHAALDRTFARIGPVLAAEESALRETLRGLAEPSAGQLRLAASHDPVLARLLEGMPAIELTTAGSIDALARLAAGQAEAAAFHYGSEGEAPPSFDAVFRDPDLTVAPLFRREQGLMLAPGNPLEISDVGAIAERGARFVNRQRGAGTRIWFDRLCREAAIDLAAIDGYHTEEFTHQAVAALIASGAADVGMGTRAIAGRFGLAFAALGWETYFLAARNSVDPALLRGLREAAAREARDTIGYTAPDPRGYQSAKCG